MDPDSEAYALSPPPASAGPSHTRLPTYDELRAEQELKESFAQLGRDHDEIGRLFRGVAAQLESTERIGEEHALCAEWDRMFKVRSVRPD